MCLKISKKTMKEEAIKRMKILELHPNAIEDFINENKLNKSESPYGALYWLDDDELKMVKDFEDRYKVLVYHVIHTQSFNLGETYELLFVGTNDKEWVDDKIDLKNGFALAQVEVLDYSPDSEMGTIGIERKNGGILRVC